MVTVEPQREEVTMLTMYVSCAHVSLTDVWRPDELRNAEDVKVNKRAVSVWAARWVIYALCFMEKGMSGSVRRKS